MRRPRPGTPLAPYESLTGYSELYRRSTRLSFMKCSEAGFGPVGGCDGTIQQGDAPGRRPARRVHRPARKREAHVRRLPSRTALHARPWPGLARQARCGSGKWVAYRAGLFLNAAVPRARGSPHRRLPSSASHSPYTFIDTRRSRVTPNTDPIAPLLIELAPDERVF